jgi:hypothetical protein
MLLYCVAERPVTTTTIELTQKEMQESFKQVEVDIEVESTKKKPEGLYIWKF